MRFVIYCLVMVAIISGFVAHDANGQPIDAARLVIENPEHYEEWMVDHARKPNTNAPGEIHGNVAVGETIVVSVPLPAVGDAILAADARGKIPAQPNLEIFDIAADDDDGRDAQVVEIELGPLTEEMFGFYLFGSLDGHEDLKTVVAVIPDESSETKRDQAVTQIEEAYDGIQPRWTRQQANDWYAQYPWLLGCNFIPSTAINQLEMWQAETFDAETIDRELGWAAEIGFNTVRVYLHDLLWEADTAGLTRRIKQYLDIADRHGIQTMFVIFDDCWNHHPKLGTQPAPIPGTHNSGWVQSPSEAVVLDPSGWGRLERYVTELLTEFDGDERILMWDLYNEPGNQDLQGKSYGLVKKTIQWAQSANPSQPLTIGEWSRERGFRELNQLQLAASDVLTFHEYNGFNSLQERIVRLRKRGRPLLCTEYMARTRGSRFESLLAVFRWENVGAYNWGLVSGKTNTIYQWDEVLDHEPDPWFHDIFQNDGTPYRAWEVRLIKELADRKPER